MATVTVPQAGSFQVADTSATVNTIALRDNNGGTAFVQCLASELKTTGTVTLNRVAKSASFTADASGYYYACDATSAIITATLPPAASVTGRVYVFKKLDAAHNVVVTANGAETIDGSNTNTLSSQYGKVTIISNGTNWEILA